MEIKTRLTNKEIKKIEKTLQKWQGNLTITHGEILPNVVDTFGLPYTDSSSMAAIWNTNSEAFYSQNLNLRFEGCTMANDNRHVAIFTELDKEGNEVKDVLIEMIV